MSVPSIVDTRQYLTFQLDDEVFALDVSRVREILEFSTMTKVPKTPGYMRGVINPRGSVVPVFDMRLKFDLARAEKTVDTCIVVVETENAIIGALVDSVREVVELEPEQIEAAPKIGIGLRMDFVRGMGKKGDSFIIILDINRVFSSEELSLEREIEEEKEVLKAVND